MSNGSTTTGVPIPGTVVPAGSLTSPGGGQGVQGIQGIQGPSDGPYVIGATSPLAQTPSGIVVPSYAQHPDAIWTPMGAFDDHFEGTTLDSKWTQFPGTAPVVPIDQSGQQIYVSNSRLCLNGAANTLNNTLYLEPYVQQSLPNANPFTIDLAIDCFAIVKVDLSVVAASYGGFFIELGNSLGSVARAVSVLEATSGPVVSLLSYVFWGVNGIDGAINNRLSEFGHYFKLVYLANSTVQFCVSTNGKNWIVQYVFTAAQTGFNTNPPIFFVVGSQLFNEGAAEILIDWIKFTNP